MHKYCKNLWKVCFQAKGVTHSVSLENNRTFPFTNYDKYDRLTDIKPHRHLESRLNFFSGIKRYFLPFYLFIILHPCLDSAFSVFANTFWNTKSEIRTESCHLNNWEQNDPQKSQKIIAAKILCVTLR